MSVLLERGGERVKSLFQPVLGGRVLSFSSGHVLSVRVGFLLAFGLCGRAGVGRPKNPTANGEPARRPRQCPLDSRLEYL